MVNAEKGIWYISLLLIHITNIYIYIWILTLSRNQAPDRKDIFNKSFSTNAVHNFTFIK